MLCVSYASLVACKLVRGRVDAEEESAIVVLLASTH